MTNFKTYTIKVKDRAADYLKNTKEILKWLKKDPRLKNNRISGKRGFAREVVKNGVVVYSAAK